MRLLGLGSMVVAGLLGFVVAPWLAQTKHMFWCGVASTLFVICLGASYYIALRFDE